MVFTPQFWEEYYTSRESDKDKTFHHTKHFFARVSTEYDSPNHNNVRYLKGDDFDEVIGKVIQFFEEKKHSFTLTMHESDDFGLDYEDELKNKGFDLRGKYWLMVADVEKLLHLDNSTPYTVRKITDEELLSDAMVSIVWKNFPQFFETIEDARLSISKRVEKNNTDDSIEIVNFAAFDEDDNPVASSALTYRSDLDEVADLSGAAVLEEHRRKGIYSQFLYERAKYAKSQGWKYFIIAAKTDTSGPIVSKFGFTKVDEIHDYWYIVDTE